MDTLFRKTNEKWLLYTIGFVLATHAGHAQTSLVASPTNLTFGPAVATTYIPAQTVTFTNTSTTALTFFAPPTVEGGPYFSTASLLNTCGSTLAAGASCSFTVLFVSITAGTYTGQVVAAWSTPSSGVTLIVPLTGTTTAANPQLFVPVTPCRVADTRNQVVAVGGAAGGPEIAAGTTRNFVVPVIGCDLPQSATAFSLNVTAVPDQGLGFMTVFPAGQTLPAVSTLNSDGRVKPNAAIVSAGANGEVSVYASDNTNVVIDVNGYFLPPTSTGLSFYQVTPCRVSDTRTSNTPLSAGVSRNFTIAGSCGVPATAQAYSLNMTAVPSGYIGFLTTWATGSPRPLASTLNAAEQAVTANAAIVPAGTNGSVSAYSSDNTDLVIDVNGYFAPPGATGALSFYPLSTPCRALDTRVGRLFLASPFSGTLPINQIGTSCPVSLLSKAYLVNATTVSPSFLGFLSLWPDGVTLPVVSTLNSEGGVASNMAIVPTINGFIDAYASQPTYLIIDVYGYFAP